jgi:hypothetical protein
MGLGESAGYKKRKGEYGGGGRSAEDYGLTDLADDVLAELARDPKRYGEKSGLAARELASRKGLSNEANAYRQALERATYVQLGNQFTQGLGQINRGLAGAPSPVADSGGANALRMKLAGDIYGRASGMIGGQYADYLKQLYGGRRNFSYQKQLLKYQRDLNKPDFGEIIGGALGGIGGSFAGGYGEAMGQRAGSK